MKKVAFLTTFAAVAFAVYPAAACEPEPAVAAATDQAPQASPTCSGVNCSAPPPTSVVTEDAAREPVTGSVPIVLASNPGPAAASVPIVLSSSREPAVASVPIVLASNPGPAAVSVPIVLSSNREPAAASVPIILSSNREPAGDGFTFKQAFREATILADASAIDEPK
jgi:hypothetical protein